MKKVVVSSMLGNILEWYDYSLYGHVAIIISMLFFPENDPYVALLIVFTIYAAGFIMRPLGAILFGYIGDIYGRRTSLAASVLLMAIPTTAIGILPTYAQVGVLAPILLTLIRLLQGLSMGGEFGGSMTFISEHADTKNRGYIGSSSVFSLGIGVMLGSITAAFFSKIMSEDSFYSWGWRVPFLISAIFGIVAFYIRSQTDESDIYKEYARKGVLSEYPFKDIFVLHKIKMLFGIALSMTVCVPFHTLTVFMGVFMKTIVKAPLEHALIMNVISMMMMSILSIFSAKLSDKWGRRPIMAIGAFGLFCWAYPSFWLLENSSFYGQLLAEVVFASFLGIYFSAVPATLVELFPTSVRYTGLAFSYNMSITIFGGSLPLLATWLIHFTGINTSVAFYIMFANMCSLIAVYFLKETYGTELK